MKRVFMSTLILVCTISLFSRCTSDKMEAKSIEQLHKENGVPVRVTVVEKKKFTFDHTFNAVLTGIKESNASALISDKVEKILYKVGDHVKKDAVVITFPTDNPGAKYFQAKVAFEHAETTLNRMKNLYQSGGISLQEFENTKTQCEVAKANWDAVKQTVKVKAPINGIITKINFQESDNVNPGDLLFTVSQTEKLKTKLWITENQILDILSGNPAIANWLGKTLEGQVVQVDQSLDSKKQAFGVVVEFENPNQEVMSGVNAEITIMGGSGEEAIIVERKDMVKKDNKNIVFVASKGVAKAMEVQVGKTRGLQVEILSGLNSGDALITEGQMLLEDNVKINIVKN